LVSLFFSIKILFNLNICRSMVSKRS